MIKTAKKKRKKEEPKIAESVLEGIGDIIPGFTKILRRAVTTEPIKKRLKEVNKEIESKLKGRKLEKSDIKVEGGWKIRSILGEKPSVKVIKKKIKPVQRKKVLTDVFDEKDKLRVITQLEIPSKDLKLRLEKQRLKICKNNKVVRTIRLPSSPKHIIKKSYKNKILTVELKK